MSLSQDTLKKDLLSAFQSMTDGDNSVFSKKVSKAVADCAESGEITTADVGTISAGAFVGAGSGSISVDSSVCEKIIIAACNAMNSMTSGGDTYLAAQMASGINAMISAGEVETDVSGTVTTPSGATSTVSGSAKGAIVCVPSTLQTALVSTFNAMQSMTEKGDEYFASQMAAAVVSYLKAGVVTTAGGSSLSGSVGTGAMS